MERSKLSAHAESTSTLPSQQRETRQRTKPTNKSNAGRQTDETIVEVRNSGEYVDVIVPVPEHRANGGTAGPSELHMLFTEAEWRKYRYAPRYR